MGVNICLCEKQTEHLIKDSSLDCYKNSEPSFISNVIRSNNNNNTKQKSNIKNEKIEKRGEYQSLFTENIRISNQNNIKPVLSTSYSNNNNSNQIRSDESYIQNIKKIQAFYRKYLKRKNSGKMIKNSENEKNDENKNEIEHCLSLRINLENAETIFSSNSFRNSHNSQEISGNNKNSDKINNKKEQNVIYPFNIKSKLKMHYKFSGYVKKIKKIKSNNSDDSNMLEKKEALDNEEKSGLHKQGFGKFIFADGTEFCGIFKDNILQTYGKFNNINQRNKNIEDKNDKEIIITDNVNYEEFMGEYKDYISDGFGIYRNFITNLKISGIFNINGISWIGIEESAEGGYIYTGEFNNNKKEGYGTITWKDGNKYQGEFKNNQLYGYGIIEFPGQKYYQGEIKNGRMDGFGEFFWKDDKRYIGNYKNDKRNGFGIFIFKSNNIKNSISVCEIENINDNNINSISAYIGFWKNGNMDGFGMKVSTAGIKYGIWENGTQRKNLESNFALKTCIKWIDKKYYKLFLANQLDILKFVEKCLNIEDDIFPVKQENS